jgi:hypothetical protein
MVNFDLNDKGNLRVLEECRETALRQIAELQPQNVAGFYDFARRIPRWFLFNGLGAIGAAQRHMEQSKSNYKRMKFAIEHCGCVAPFCNQDQLRAYMDFVGKARTAQECNYIFCMGLPHSEAAGKLINQWRNLRPNDWVVGAERTLYRLDTPLMLPAAPVGEETPVDRHSAVGNDTRLGAIAVPAVPFETQPLDDPVQVQAVTEPAVRTIAAPPAQRTAFTTLMDAPYISRAFFGAQRTGKSLFASEVSKQMSKELGTQIFHLNLASYGEEDARYWSHAKSVTGDLVSMSEGEARVLIVRALGLLREFHSHPGDKGAILIVDEATYVGAINNAYAELLEPINRFIADKITAYTSTGMKRTRAIWTIAPEFVAGALVQDAKSIKKLGLVYVTIAPGKFVEWKGNKIGFSPELFGQLKNNFDAVSRPPQMNAALEPHDRICLVGEDWLPVGLDAKVAAAQPNIFDSVPVAVASTPTPMVKSAVSVAVQEKPEIPQFPVVAEDKFSRLMSQLKDESQTELKSFVKWLSDRKRKTVSFDQIKDTWAKNNGVKRDRETLDTYIQIAKSQKLITVSSDSNWLVGGG